MIDPITKAILRGLNFYQYAKEISLGEKSPMFPITQLAFEAKQENLAKPIRSRKEYIVLTPEETNPKKSSFIIHPHLQNATDHGQRTLGRRRFTIMEWSRYIKTKDYQNCSRLQAYQQRKCQRKLINIKIISTPKKSENLSGKNDCPALPSQLSSAERFRLKREKRLAMRSLLSGKS